MRTMNLLAILLLSFFSLACSDTQDPVIPPTDEQENPNPNPNPDPDSGSAKEQVLVFTKTMGYRHASIDAGLNLLQDLATQEGFELKHTENASEFTTDKLNTYGLVIFLNTTGDILNADQQQAFEAYMDADGSFMGIHSATDTEYDWAWYGNLVGAYFDSHPEVQEAVLRVHNESHPAVDHLNSQWIHTDEWYNFRNLKRDQINVVLEVDESTYEGGSMGASHPIAWYREYAGGKVFYTALGHTSEAYSDPDFKSHIAGGIAYCLDK